MIEWVEDADIWRWALEPASKAFHAGLAAVCLHSALSLHTHAVNRDFCLLVSMVSCCAGFGAMDLELDAGANPSIFQTLSDLDGSDVVAKV